MVTTSSVSAERMIRTAVQAMHAARFMREEPRSARLEIFDLLKYQLIPLVGIFARPLMEADLFDGHIDRLLKGKSGPNHPLVDKRGIILLRDWQPGATGVPSYLICFTREQEWLVLDRNVIDGVVIGGSEILLDYVGGDNRVVKEFLSQCQNAVHTMFYERRQKIWELEDGCLIDLIVKSFDPSKLQDVRYFLADL